MSNRFRSPEFRTLFKEWNKRLEESGFKDAEDFSLPEPCLKDWHSQKWDKPSAPKSQIEAAAYYELASDLLHNGFSFKTDVHRRTWELHCSGLSLREIEGALFSQLIGYPGRKKSNVQEIIVFIQKKSGIKRV